MLQQAYQYSSVVFLYICLVASINARGETYFVGDGNDWTGLTNFSWADGKEFHVGDVLVFNYNTSLHNVLQVKSAAYEGTCIKESGKLFASGNDSLALSGAGEYWFICGMSDHCENGQKLGIFVFP